ncbi:MAG: hypothetical protein J3Q66DRAFT_27757 [Benniella sp.]|nr:MAG: hypothetical protein J3Q66DRAFT_27757 [Benniella sp.]
MRTPKEAPTTEPKKKSLTIHISTDHVGPHGMPLVYGSTPDKIGSIKGTVRFETNYDCRGRDIVILYEAKAEAQWTALENKKVVNHHTEEIFGHQTWHFPLEHTKLNGITVVKGKYEKEFEVQLVHPLVQSRSSTLPLTGSPTNSASTTTSSRSNALLPSSSYGPNAKMKYTIRAILQRPFPCITDIEASQEVWVLQSCLPPAKLKYPLKPPRLLLTDDNHKQVDPSAPATTPPATTGSTTSPPSTPIPAPLEGEQEAKPLMQLTMPSKVFKSALSMLPTIDLSRSKQLLPLSFPSLPVPLSPKIPPQGSSSSEKTQPKNQPSTEATASTIQPSLSNDPQSTSSPVTVPSSPSDASTSSKSPLRSSVGTTRKNSVESSDSRWSEDEDPANYTGLWELFQVPYSCSLPSETVYPGQRIPLTIRFGPRKGDRRRRRDATGVNSTINRGDRRKHRRHEHKQDEDDDSCVHARDNSPPGLLPRFVVKKGIAKVVEHTLLREVTVMPAPSKLRNRKQAIPMSTTSANNTQGTLVQDIPFDRRRAKKQTSEQSLMSGNHASVSSIPGSVTKKQSKALIYQEKSYNGSHSHLYDLLQQETHVHDQTGKGSIGPLPPQQQQQQQQDQRRRPSSDLKRLFFKPKRHSMDFSTERPSTPTRDPSSSAAPPLSPTLQSQPPRPLSPNAGTRIVNTIEAKFKTEVMALTLTPQLQKRETQYQRRLRRKLRRRRPGSDDEENGHDDHGDDEDDTEDDINESEGEGDEDEEDVWQATIWIQLPGSAELATFTETKHIVKKHTLQLILLCGLVGSTASNGSSVSMEAGSGGGTSSEKVITQPGVNKEFRLEMDLHVTGPRAPE